MKGVVFFLTKALQFIQRSAFWLLKLSLMGFFFHSVAKRQQAGKQKIFINNNQQMP
jgi:hypothetical protein